MASYVYVLCVQFNSYENKIWEKLLRENKHLQCCQAPFFGQIIAFIAAINILSVGIVLLMSK